MLFSSCIGVEYFNQCEGAVHSKRWSKYAFLMFFMPKIWNKDTKHKYYITESIAERSRASIHSRIVVEDPGLNPQLVEINNN